MNKHMKSKVALFLFVGVMAGMILFAIFFRDSFVTFLQHPVWLEHARFVHIAAASLFFSNAIVGFLWEMKSLASGNKAVILHTYNTVTFLDSMFSSPLIILLLLGGLSLSFTLGDLWQIGWLSLSFHLFLLSGVLWIASDIPTQYKVKRLISQLNQDDQDLPAELLRLLKLRWWISMAGVLPLVIVFILMVYRPDIAPIGDWFR